MSANRAVHRVEAETVALGALRDRAAALKAAGYRYATATCLDRGEHLDVIHHFDRDLELLHVRVEVPKDAAMPSLSSVYLCAFLVENEMSELFGLKVDGLAIDFGGGLMLAEGTPKAPMLKGAR